MKYDHGDGKVNRRYILALSSLPLLGLRKAEAMTEAEELAKLQVEAARIQEIINVQKAGNSNLPSLRDSSQLVFFNLGVFIKGITSSRGQMVV